MFSQKNRLQKIYLTRFYLKLLPNNVTFRIYPHQGKQDLEKALTTALPRISRSRGARILILRDQDSENCKVVKERLQDLIKGKCKAPVLIRIVCRELESWFLEDLNAVKQAYPKFKPENYQNKAKFKKVDNIQSPNQLLRSLIPEYQKSKYLLKLEVYANISPFLDLSNNNSSSFNHTIAGIKNLIK
jgi:hypothetical protein